MNHLKSNRVKLSKLSKLSYLSALVLIALPVLAIADASNQSVAPVLIKAAPIGATTAAPSATATPPAPTATAPTATTVSTSTNSSSTQKKNTGSIGGINLSEHTRRLDESYLRLANPEQGYFETLPSTTFDLALLKERDKFDNRSLNLGGYMEWDAQYWKTHNAIATGLNNAPLPVEGTGLYTTTIDLDAMSNLNSWTTMFAKVEQENIGTPQAHMIFRKALVTFGNLDITPFFLTLGKSFLPFGVYGGGGVWSVPLTRSVFRPSEVPQAMLGYYKNGFNSNLAVFSNQGGVSGSIADFVYSVYFNGTVQDLFSYTLGAGYMNDLRGLPSGLGSAYQSSGVLDSSKRVGAYDLNAELSYQHLNLTAEYISATRQGIYNSNLETSDANTVVPGEGQKTPSAWELGAAYNQAWLGAPMYYTISYSRTYHMAGVPMGWTSQPIPGPSAIDGIKNAWILSVARQIRPDLIVGFEAQRGVTYADHFGGSYTLDLSMYF